MNTHDKILMNKKALANPSEQRSGLTELTLSDRAIALVLDKVFDRIRVLEEKLSRGDTE